MHKHQEKLNVNFMDLIGKSLMFVQMFVKTNDDILQLVILFRANKSYLLVDYALSTRIPVQALQDGND